MFLLIKRICVNFIAGFTLSAGVVSVSNIPQSGVGNSSVMPASYSFSFRTGLIPSRLISIEYYKIVGQRQVSVYLDNNGIPGKLLATSSEVANQYTSWNNQVYNFPEKPRLQENSRYWIKGAASGGETWCMMGEGVSVISNYGWEIFGAGYNPGGAVNTTAFLKIRAESEVDGLVASYPLNGDGVGALLDSGTKTDFTSQVINAKPARNRFNLDSQSVELTRSSQSRINIQTGGLQLGVYSMSAWILPKEVPDYSDCTIFATDKWALSIFRNGLRLTSFGGGTDTQGLVENNKWVHVCLVFNGSSASVYLNGVRMISNYGNPGTFQISRERILRLGVFDYYNAGGFFSENYFNGVIDDFRIYDRVLTDSDVLNSYQFNGSGMPGSTGFVWIAPGKFTMGSPLGEEGRMESETQHEVTLSQGFWMSDHEVTQSEYQSVTGQNPSYFSFGLPGDLDRPIETVSWFEAVKYCIELTNRERALGRIAEKEI